jgi:hypothetical protein
MPVTLNVGVSRKLGLPDYCSVGASCTLQFELDPLVLREEPTVQSRIQEAFEICSRAIENQLSTHKPTEMPRLSAPADCLPEEAEHEQVPLATTRQLDFVDHLARQIRQLGCQRLKLLTEHLYGRPLAELTASQASQLIDLLKEMRAGTRSVEDSLPQPAM